MTESYLDSVDLYVDENSILQPLGLKILRDSRLDLLPAIREQEEELPGIDGTIDFDSKLEPRLLELHFATDDNLSALEKEQIRQNIASTLNPKTGAKKLIWADDPDKTYFVKYAGSIPYIPKLKWFDAVIPLKCVNPYIIGTELQTHSGSGTLENEGTEETPLIIEVEGELTNPDIVVESTTLTYTGTISEGETLVINTGKQTVKLDGENVLENFNEKWPMLQPGNTEVVADNKVTFKWRSRWV